MDAEENVRLSAGCAKSLAMIRKEGIRLGVILRMLSHHLGTPLHAIATVETIETSRMGTWLGTLRHDNKRTTKRQYLYRSHLWGV